MDKLNQPSILEPPEAEPTVQRRELVQFAMRAQGVVDRFDARETALEAQADRDAQDAREALHVFVMEGCS